jgi:predicted transcriptional regulator
MATKEDGVLILSLHPRFAEAIYRREKTVELRRAAPRRRYSLVLIYETAPVRKLTGCFRVTSSKSMSPSRAWREFGREISISRREFRKYLRAAKTATLLFISSPRRFLKPVSLCRLRGSPKPPQSFCYTRARPRGA